jgi:hypothetical protein
MSWRSHVLLRGVGSKYDVNPAADIFLYLPLPYWAVFIMLLYWHDLSRLFHPFNDNGSVRNWWYVLGHLNLLSNEQVARRPGRKGEFLPYIVYLIVSVAVSISWVLRLFPPLWYYLIIVQGFSAIILTAATMQYLGQPPRRPYVDMLQFPRLGSRVRHLANVPTDRQEGAK